MFDLNSGGGLANFAACRAYGKIKAVKPNVIANCC